MDIYSETLVTKKYSKSEKAKIKKYLAASIIVPTLLILVVPYAAWAIKLPILMWVSLIICGAFLIYVYLTLKKMLCEYEYIITNDNLDFDVIINKKKRERLISIDIRTIEEIDRYDESKFIGSNFDEIIHAERDSDGHDNFYLIVSHPKRKRVQVIFTPDQKMLEATKKTLNPRLARSLPTEI